FVAVPLLTDQFRYDQDVYAAYLSFTMKIGENYGLVAGARYEHTTIGGEYQESGETPFTQEYDNILPSIIISRTFKNFSTLKASYNQRIQRPSLFFINPFTQAGDPNNLTFGNPTLDPEVVDQYELSYGTFVKGVSLNLAVYYRQTTDVIEGFVEIDPVENVSTTSYLNIGVNNSVGTNIFTSVNIKKVGSFRLGFNLFTYNAESTVEDIDLTRDAIVWSGNAGANINLPRDWKYDLFAFARSPNQTLQGENASFWLYGMGLRKEFNKRFSLGIRAIEPFNRSKSFPSDIVGDGFIQRSNFSIPFRSIGFSIRYNFGQLDFKGSRRGRGTKIKNDDQKSGEGGNF
ncbi:MAG: outer membrane beta-barrel family protein, partial [Bacteroidota bacterium]